MKLDDFDELISSRTDLLNTNGNSFLLKENKNDIAIIKSYIADKLREFGEKLKQKEQTAQSGTPYENDNNRVVRAFNARIDRELSELQ